MKRILYLFLFISFSLSAEIYRLIDDESGSVSYSDQHHPDATLIEIKALPTYTPDVTNLDSLQEKVVEEESDLFVPDYKVAIISPSDQHAFWENSGTVAVQVEIQPELDKSRGDLINILLDGKQIGDPQESTVVSLTEIDRGKHSIVASVVSKEGNVLSTSEPITFQLHRRSLINQPNN